MKRVEIVESEQQHVLFHRTHFYFPRKKLQQCEDGLKLVRAFKCSNSKDKKKKASNKG